MTRTTPPIQITGADVRAALEHLERLRGTEAATVREAAADNDADPRQTRVAVHLLLGIHVAAMAGGDADAIIAAAELARVWTGDQMLDLAALARPDLRPHLEAAVGPDAIADDRVGRYGLVSRAEGRAQIARLIASLQAPPVAPQPIYSHADASARALDDR